MDEVRLLLRRLEKEAREKFGKRYRLWSEPYPFPGGCISKNPRYQPNYIVTIDFLKEAWDIKSLFSA